MAGQLIGLLLLGIAAAHLIAILIEGEGILPQAREYSLVRIAAAYRAVEACAPDETPALLAALESSDAVYRLLPAPPELRPMSAADAELAAELATFAGLPPAAAIHVYVQADTEAYLPGSPRYGLLEARLRLSDGRWLHASLRPRLRSQWWLKFSVPVSVLPVLPLVLLFAWRILRPTRALAEAAERISRGERIDPLPVTGPVELREATAAFNTMHQRLTRFVADRTAMLAAIGHDFRTPLTALRLQVELLEDEAVRAPMRRIIDDMRDMIDETLRFARDDSVREPTQEADLAELVAHVGSRCLELGQAVSWAVPGPVPYRCRPLALGRALANLVDNAVRYGGTARIRLDAPPAGDSLLITVDDDGPGIPEDWLERVFEPFARPAPARDMDTGGIGLGLAIARSCIAAHGGEIHLANRREGGLTATIALPA
ncbi:HAMP domain-containing protein [Pseudothauera rhizosphaerae]|uniref:histidine kinase n=1 Tax=Pseudothauera rhizosphaerae TaxID=2565932 RepID=A0A4S4AMB5_9RHOO|nr:HAMP domain-containing protein [Pseudothauera rhizosphaerae]